MLVFLLFVDSPSNDLDCVITDADTDVIHFPCSSHVHFNAVQNRKTIMVFAVHYHSELQHVNPCVQDALRVGKLHSTAFPFFLPHFPSPPPPLCKPSPSLFTSPSLSPYHLHLSSANHAILRASSTHKAEVEEKKGPPGITTTRAETTLQFV